MRNHKPWGYEGLSMAKYTFYVSEVTIYEEVQSYLSDSCPKGLSNLMRHVAEIQLV